MVLHHLGDSTLSDIKAVEKECVAAGAKTVIVAGDISNEQTATDVSLKRVGSGLLLDSSPLMSLLIPRSYQLRYPPSPA
jgi:L-rhamnose 1-dehydrogenase